MIHTITECRAMVLHSFYKNDYPIPQTSKIIIMKKLIFLIVAMLLCGTIFAQTGFITPDLEQIKKETNDKKSPHYFPKLAKRFAQADTTMDIEDLQAFYYGAAFQEDYSPYKYYKQFDTIRGILNKEEEPSKADLEQALALTKEVVKADPTEPNSYYYQYVIYSMLAEKHGGDTAAAQKAQMQFETLFYTMTSAGNGISAEDAMYVTHTSHEFLIMSMFGFQPISQALIPKGGHSYDLLYVEENEYGVDSLYFNIDLIIQSWGRKLPSSSKAKEAEKTTSIDIPLGSYFVIELDKPKKKESKFRLVSLDAITDTIIGDERDSLFKEEIPDNQIVGYFCPTRLYAGSENIYNCLIFVSKCNKPLFYNSDILINGFSSFQSTSNCGMLYNVMGNEMWSDPIKIIRISNIRTKK